MEWNLNRASFLKALEGELEAALEVALRRGYRHIDTATFYGNEGVVGKVLEDWIAAGHVRCHFILS